MSLFDCLVEGLAYSGQGLVLIGLLGCLLGFLVWPLVGYVPACLQVDWRATARHELGLPTEVVARPKWSWQRPLTRHLRLARAGFCLLLGVLLGALYGCWGWGSELFWGSLLSLWLLVLAFIDAQTRLLPDVLTLSCLWLGLLGLVWVGDQVALSAGVVGACAGYVTLWCLAWVFKRCTGQEGMGHGDFKLFAALGAWLGVMALPWVLFLAAGLGVLWACLTGRLKQALPFGPFLALAGWLVWMWGRPLLYG